MNLPFANRGGDREEPRSAYDARPLVAIRRDDRSAWWFAGGAIIAAALLFSALEARRQATQQAEATGTASSAVAAEAVPDLVIPDLPAEPPPIGTGEAWPQPGDARPNPVRSFAPPQARVSVAPSTFQPQPNYNDYPSPLPAPAPTASGAAFPAPISGALARRGVDAAEAGRVMASRLDNPATTVIQGTLINAVLETALDSTRPGQTRAIVTRDIYGFDGTRLLIPRGTRLYGTYEADVSEGQKRARILWTRLLRPDGVSVALDSPAADPLGRAGVAAKVDNHFFQRFGNALLGTPANIGSALVTRSVGNAPVVVAVPGSTQAVAQPVLQNSGQINPTLTVRQGTRITVFVQHDLDFSSVEAAP
jgi:type IV secretion system protein VirB10